MFKLQRTESTRQQFARRYQERRGNLYSYLRLGVLNRLFGLNFLDFLRFIVIGASESWRKDAIIIIDYHYQTIFPSLCKKTKFHSLVCSFSMTIKDFCMQTTSSLKKQTTSSVRCTTDINLIK